MSFKAWPGRLSTWLTTTATAVRDWFGRLRLPFEPRSGPSRDPQDEGDVVAHSLDSDREGDAAEFGAGLLARVRRWIYPRKQSSMIKLTDTQGQALYLAPGAIAEVREAGASSQWHGTRAIVRTFDGRTLEVQESAAEIARLVTG